MDIDQARTFLAIAAYGSFLDASRHLNLTQSTVSARIQRLEDELGVRLFVRNRSGATLTTGGRRFDEYAKRLVLTAEQARHHVGLPSRYRATVRIGGRIALWEGLLPNWVGWMRNQAPDVAIHAEIGFEEDLMRRLIEGTLDIGLMYSPSHSPGLIVEHLFDENLILVSSRPEDTRPGDDYIYVEWGPAFEIQHALSYPDLEPPPQVVNIGWLGVQLILANGGSCYLPERMAGPLIAAGRLHAVTGAPRYAHPTYLVYPKESDNPVAPQALDGLRALARPA
ncbi:MAG: LysR family transcriptional regulator [Parasulfuritortus sp.]|jgi:DNA-binding transcriptional LysR family regulator|nr:LysR family transcriptional regulator [Parasulfuritortus sp.]